MPQPFFRPLLCLLLAATVAACSSTGASNGNTSYTDDYGRTVNVPQHPRRIVSLSPAVTEILFSLGAQDRLAGRTQFCSYPPECLDIENIGGISNLNIEKIVSVAPDLVISGSMVPQKSVEQLEKLGIPIVCVIEKKNFDGLYQNIAAIGRLAGCDTTAQRLCDSIRRAMKSIAANTDSTKKSVYYVVGYGAEGNFTAGGNTFINDIIAFAGGRNIAEQVQGWSYSVEKLIDENPDYVIIRREDSAAFCHTRPYSMLDAVADGRVIAIESGSIDLQVPRNVDAIKLISNAMHSNDD